MTGKRGPPEPLQQYDPICGRRVRGESMAPFSLEYKRRRYFFCSERCRKVFERHAERLRLKELARAGALLSPGRVSWGIA